jgi:phosphoglycolate phosphatase
MQKVVLFDFDGTLADSFATVVDIFYDITGTPPITDPEMIAFLRKQPMSVIIKEMHIKPFQVPRLVVKGRKMMAGRMDEIKLFEGVREALTILHEQGYQLYVMSSNSASNIEHFLKANQLQSYFVRVYGGVGLLNKAAAIRKVMRQNGLDAAHCIYVGDEARDIEGAQKAGVKIVSVGWGYNDAIMLRARKPDVLIDKPQQLAATIQGL